MAVLSLRYPVELEYSGRPDDVSSALAAANDALRAEHLAELRAGREGIVWMSLEPVSASGLLKREDRDTAFDRALERVDAVLSEYPFHVRLSESVASKSAGLPLYVAVSAGCNLKCWYCTEHGESRGFERPRLETERLVELLQAAYEAGYRKFRFTGGEPTNNPSLADILLATQAFGPDVRTAITTNGAHLERLLPALSELVKPQIFLSVDGLAGGVGHNETQQEFSIAKWLTTELMSLVDRVRDHASVRFNFVLTRSSRDQLWPIIDLAVKERIDLKIFELLLRDFFFAHGQPRSDVFTQQYVSVREVIPRLRQFGEPTRFPGLGGRGIPMSYVSTGSSRIIFFDSLAGSHYSARACHGCDHFPCQEGLYAPMLNASGTLHPAGCLNEDLYLRVARSDPAVSRAAFHTIRRDIQRSKLENVVPKELRGSLQVA